MAQMIHSLNKHYPLLIAIGAIITLLASVITLTGGGQFNQAQPVITSTAIWLPAFRLVGITLVLGGVVMALDLLCTRLPAVHSRITGLAVPCMSASLLLAAGGFITSLYLAGVVTGATEAAPAIVAGTIFSWLEVLQLASMALMLLAISSGLYTVFQLLRHQQTAVQTAPPSNRLPNSKQW